MHLRSIFADRNLEDFLAAIRRRPQEDSERNACRAAGPSPIVKVAVFTAEQLADINAQRVTDDLEPIHAVIVFNGKHLYKSRCLRDGYSIDEVLEQIRRAFSSTSVVAHDGTTTITSTVPGSTPKDTRS